MSLRSLIDRAKITGTLIILSVKKRGGLGYGGIKELSSVWTLEPLYPDLSRSGHVEKAALDFLTVFSIFKRLSCSR